MVAPFGIKVLVDSESRLWKSLGSISRTFYGDERLECEGMKAQKNAHPVRPPDGLKPADGRADNHPLAKHIKEGPGSAALPAGRSIPTPANWLGDYSIPGVFF